MKKDYENIRLALRKELPKLNAEFNVSTLEVFGSYVRNEQNSNSDLDVLVTFSKVPDLLQFIELENYLSDLLELKVDLVMRSALKPNIGKRIISEAKPVL
ncbi:MAG: nucleotidyltransferase family protein [Chlorobiales bacterium]|nr:nucleotidyltransferase family protein [Chlorobiales bacterium]